jgi:hypothetical protein
MMDFKNDQLDAQYGELLRAIESLIAALNQRA